MELKRIFSPRKSRCKAFANYWHANEYLAATIMSIKVTGLLKLYGEQRAVNNISFEASKGKITGFLGPNGAGKSTTMKMVTGYLQPDGGTATVAGINVIEQ